MALILPNVHTESDTKKVELKFLIKKKQNEDTLLVTPSIGRTPSEMRN
jgi:hypothetical protein